MLTANTLLTTGDLDLGDGVPIDILLPLDDGRPFWRPCCLDDVTGILIGWLGSSGAINDESDLRL